MKTDTSAGIASLLSHKIALPDSVENLRAAYKNARPFPHVLIDNLFDNKVLDELVAEIPPMRAEKWVHENNDHLQKYNLRSAVELGETGYQLTAFLHSASFLYFLSEMTGIWNLLPDPYLQGSGYHMIPKGGSFDIHADRNTAYETGLTRRLSLIVYLNKDWKHEYGGQLELWDTSGTRCEVVVEPLFNRTIIFEITDKNFHGVPATVACPDGRARTCFVIYYHTVGAGGKMDVVPHTSIYAPNFYRKEKFSLGKAARDLTPPMLLRGLKKLRGRP
jgi:2OG-Fe(II) oxygenase superfamily